MLKQAAEDGWNSGKAKNKFGGSEVSMTGEGRISRITEAVGALVLYDFDGDDQNMEGDCWQVSGLDLEMVGGSISRQMNPTDSDEEFKKKPIPLNYLPSTSNSNIQALEWVLHKVKKI